MDDLEPLENISTPQGHHQGEQVEEIVSDEENAETSPRSYWLARDRQRREIRAPKRYDEEGYYGEDTDDEEDDFFFEALITTLDAEKLEPASYA